MQSAGQAATLLDSYQVADVCVDVLLSLCCRRSKPACRVLTLRSACSLGKWRCCLQQSNYVPKVWPLLIYQL